MSFAARLKKLRKASGQTLQQVADGAGTTKSHVWELERRSSANPGLVLLKAIAKHFNTSVAYLAGEERKP